MTPQPFFPPITLDCGLQVRGLLSMVLTKCTVKPCPIPDDGWEVSIEIQVPSSQPADLGGNWPDNGRVIGVEFHRRYSCHDPQIEHGAPRGYGRGMTQEQRAVALALRQMWGHEFAETLWLDDAPLGDPESLHY